MFFGVFKEKEVIDDNNQTPTNNDLLEDFGNALDNPDKSSVDLIALTSFQSSYPEKINLIGQTPTPQVQNQNTPMQPDIPNVSNYSNVVYNNKQSQIYNANQSYPNSNMMNTNPKAPLPNIEVNNQNFSTIPQPFNQQSKEEKNNIKIEKIENKEQTNNTPIQDTWKPINNISQQNLKNQTQYNNVNPSTQMVYNKQPNSQYSVPNYYQQMNPGLINNTFPNQIFINQQSSRVQPQFQNQQQINRNQSWEQYVNSLTIHNNRNVPLPTNNNIQQVQRTKENIPNNPIEKQIKENNNTLDNGNNKVYIPPSSEIQNSLQQTLEASKDSIIDEELKNQVVNEVSKLVLNKILEETGSKATSKIEINNQKPEEELPNESSKIEEQEKIEASKEDLKDNASLENSSSNISDAEQEKPIAEINIETHDDNLEEEIIDIIDDEIEEEKNIENQPEIEDNEKDKTIENEVTQSEINTSSNDISLMVDSEPKEDNQEIKEKSDYELSKVEETNENESSIENAPDFDLESQISIEQNNQENIETPTNEIPISLNTPMTDSQIGIQPQPIITPIQPLFYQNPTINSDIANPNYENTDNEISAQNPYNPYVNPEIPVYTEMIPPQPQVQEEQFQIKEQVNVPAGYKVCPKCGQVMRDDYKLCFVCGTYF